MFFCGSLLTKVYNMGVYGGPETLSPQSDSLVDDVVPRLDPLLTAENNGEIPLLTAENNGEIPLTPRSLPRTTVRSPCLPPKTTVRSH